MIYWTSGSVRLIVAAMTHIAVLGLGAMGSGMARNFVAAGHTVTVWNRTEPTARALAADLPGVHVAGTPADAARAAEVVVSMVRDDDASHATWLTPGTGAVAGLDGTEIAIESSTVTPAWVRELGLAVAATGARFIEAPVAGSRPQLAEGALVYLLGGEPDDIAVASPFLEVNGSALRHLGPVGWGAAAKLAVNGLFGIQVVAFAEALGFLERSGMDRDVAATFLSALPLTSPYLQRILALFSSGDFSPNFPIDLVAKDFGYLSDTATTIGAGVPTAAAVRDVFAAGVAEGLGELDISGISRRFT